jgi:tetratricopeptide (TPR) repeat protein
VILKVLSRPGQSWLKLIPTLAYDSYLNAGSAYEQVAAYEQARSEYTRAMEIDRDRVYAYKALATLDEIESNWDGAIERYRTLERIAPGLAAWTNIRVAGVHAARGNYVEAENTIREAIQLDPGEPLSFIELARLGAIEQREDLVREGRDGLEPISRDQLYDLEMAVGNEYRALQHYKQAEGSYKKCIQRDPARPDAYIGLGRLSMEQKWFTESENWLKCALELDSRSVAAYQVLSEVCQKQGNLPGVIDAEQHIAQLAPASRYDGFIAIGEMYEKADQLDEAESQFRTAINFAPWRPDAYIYLSSLFLRRGKSREAEKIYKEAADKASVDYFALGLYYEREKKRGDAETVYRLGIEYAPAEQKPEFYLVLGNLYRSLQDYAQAEETYRQVIQFFPQRAYYAYGFIGQLHSEQQHYDEAEKAYRQAITVNPQRRDAYNALREYW